MKTMYIFLFLFIAHHLTAFSQKPKHLEESLPMAKVPVKIAAGPFEPTWQSLGVSISIMVIYSSISVAQLVSTITINPGEKITDINPLIYGQFLEHINHSVDLGLHGEMLAERSFIVDGRNGEPSYMWQSTANDSIDNIKYTITKLNPYNGASCLQITLLNKKGIGEGIYQSGIAVKKNQVLKGYIHLRSNDAKGPVIVGLRSNKGEIYTQYVINKISPAWQRYDFELSPTISDSGAEFFITFQSMCENMNTTIWSGYFVDMVSLMPKQYEEKLPLRPDLYEAAKALQPTIIRWPGGSYASIYDWKKGIGVIDKRQAQMMMDWGDGPESDPSTFGTDEFISFCRGVGAEPFLVINASSGVKSAMDWIEYCNGDINSEWGAKRVANGYLKSHKVSHWAIDNESWLMGVEGYSELAIDFIDKIRSKYPSLKLYVVGSGQLLEKAPGFYNRANFGPKIIDKIGSRADYSSLHYYYGGDYGEDFATLMSSNLNIERAFKKEYELFQKYSLDRNVKIAFDEWNPGELKFSAGLASALLLNSMERLSDIVSMTAPALWFRNRTLSNTWDNALINYDNHRWFPSFTYVSMKLWREFLGQELLESTFDGPKVSGVSKELLNNEIVTKNIKIPALDIVASRDTFKNQIILKVVNRSADNNITTRIDGFDFKKASAFVLYCENLDIENTLDEPEKVTVVKEPVDKTSSGATFTFKKHSANVLVFEY
jgi:alpha-N-arabinofuranosidase